MVLPGILNVPNVTVGHPNSFRIIYNRLTCLELNFSDFQDFYLRLSCDLSDRDIENLEHIPSRFFYTLSESKRK